LRESSIREAIIWMAEVTRKLPEKVSAAPMTAAGIASSRAPSFGTKASPISSAPIAKPMIRLLAPVACDSPTAPEVGRGLPEAAEQAGDNVRQSIGGYAAGQRFHVRPLPVRVVHALRRGDRPDAVKGDRDRGDGERHQKAGVEGQPRRQRSRQADQRGCVEAIEIGWSEQSPSRSRRGCRSACRTASTGPPHTR